MYKPLVFISHSAKDEAAQKVLLRLYRALSKDFEVLLDRKRLQANDYWRRELNTWMALSHAALVLLSSDAISNSPWVKKEATILTYRREMDDNFVLIPILLPPVTRNDLVGGDFSPLALDQIQMLSGDSPESIADKVLERLEPLKARAGRKTALQEVEHIVAQMLDELESRGNPPTTLDRAAEVLGTKLKWKTNKSQSEQLARELLSADLQRMTDTIVFLTPYFKQKETATRLLDRLTPFWVDPDAVSELPRINNRPRRQRAVSVNGVEHPFTGKCYIQRACGRPYDWVFAEVIKPKGYEETPEAMMKIIEDEILRQVASKMGFEEGDEVDADRIKQESYDRENEEPFFILVPKDFDHDLVDKLREKFEAFTFFLLNGDEEPDAQMLKDKHIIFLKPQLKPKQDQEIFNLVRRAKSKIKLTR